MKKNGVLLFRIPHSSFPIGKAASPVTRVRETEPKAGRQVFWLTARGEVQAAFPRWHRSGNQSPDLWPITAAALRRILTGFPLRRPQTDEPDSPEAI
jgi:hypothetical protein